MAIFVPTSMKFSRHMYPYTWQLSAKFSKLLCPLRSVIAKNEFTMLYVIARLMRAVRFAQMTMVSNWPHWSALSNDTKYSICSRRKLWVNRIWIRVTIRIPPSFRPIITRFSHDVIFQDCYSVVLVWAAVRAKARVATCSSCTNSYWFCTQCLRALSRSLPLLQFPSKFVGVVSSIPSRSLNSSFSGNPHAWPSRHHFFRFAPFWWPFFRPNYLHYHRSYRLLTYCSG